MIVLLVMAETASEVVAVVEEAGFPVIATVPPESGLREIVAQLGQPHLPGLPGGEREGRGPEGAATS